jgi:hypothetical protein
MKKVYFACSITGGRQQADKYPAVVQYIQDAGAQVLSELFSGSEIDASKGVSINPGATPREIWEWDLDWIREADAIVAEVSQPSFGVGYEIAKAHEWHKPVLALYQTQEGKKLSSMIAGSPNVTVCEYTDIDQTQKVIQEFITKL